MTKTIIKLHTTLWGRTIKSNPSVLIMALVMGLYVVLGMASLGLLMFFEVQEGNTFVIPVAIATGIFTYVLLTAMMPSGEQQVTARDLAILPITPKQVTSGLWWTLFLHSRAFMAVFCTVVTALVVCLAAGSITAVLVGIPFFVVSLLTTILGGEVVGRFLGRGATGKDRLAALGTLGLVGLILGFNVVVNNGNEVPLDTLGKVLAWTPFGAVGGAVGASISGQWAIAVAQGVIALVTLGAVLWLWNRGVAQDMREPQIHSAAAKKKKKKERTGKEGLPTIFLPGLKHTAGAAIFSRALRYMRRDSRMMGSLLPLPFVLVFFLYRAYEDGGMSGYMGAFILSFVLSASAANDIGYDGPGGWLHIVSGVRARTLLLARHAGTLAIMAVLMVLYYVVLLLILPDRGLTLTILPAVLGYAITGAATSLYLTVYNPFPTSRPGTNPWSDRSGYSSAAMLSGFMFLLTGWIPLIPGIVGLGMGRTQDMPWVTVLGGIAAVVIPLVIYIVVIRRCVGKLEKNWPEIYGKVRSWVN
ncbi:MULTISPECIES: hypothetical protein [unclassified Corynebacterium]|uniref:hypothetical protein n=1 Tax=unclassified Corynebacterium TaxID=2624378 RepID=UPI0029CA76FF|nr:MULTISPECIES: hypothetical protein [unclassified Corynebacterium]WPF65321.1 hypothetical protein OLX12_06955 [Corynebacterium sp. 22KM0430]WPF67816.1 hypothetical protein OLW90_06945 [Corynebacterium sp. 21KM1197]